jgi:putative ABC transport system permease protein
MMRQLWQDLTYAVKALRGNPTYSIAAIATLGLALAATTTMFSVVTAVVLRPLPVRAQDSVVVVWAKNLRRDFPHVPFSHREFRLARERSRALRQVAALDYFGSSSVMMNEGDAAVPVRATRVTGDFFGVLGVVPALGRALQADDDAPGATPVVVISYGLWQRSFGGDADVLAQSVRIFGRYVSIVGVMPRGFDYPRNAEVWVPLLPLYPGTVDDAPDVELDIIGRLGSGVKVEQVGRELHAVFSQENSEQAEIFREYALVTHTLPELILGRVRGILFALMAAVMLLLVLACTNVTSLLLVRSMDRQRELAVRVALGASQARIASHLIAEGVLLATAGGVFGLLATMGILRTIVALAPPDVPRLEDLRVDGLVLAFTAGVLVAVTVVVSLVPSVQVARLSSATILRSNTLRASGTGRRLLRRVLVAGQVAVASVVLVGTGLVTRSLINLLQVDLGFRAEQLAVVRLVNPFRFFEVPERYFVFLDQVSERLGGTPGIVSASPALMEPLASEGGFDVVASLPGQDDQEIAANPYLNFEAVGANYFATIGAPIRRGRGFSGGDAPDGLPVIVVNEATARALWPGSDPIGKQLSLPFPGLKNTRWTVIGVVADSRYRNLMAAQPSLYVSLAQFRLFPASYLLVRTVSDPVDLLPTLRRLVGDLDPEISVLSVTTVTQFLERPLSVPRFSVALFGSFAAIAVVLAATGIYGVMASYVRQHNREMGIRLALGAQTREVRRLVLREGIVLAAIGTAVGIASALAAGRSLRALLYGIGSTDWVTLAGTAVVMLMIALCASYIPARRAMRADPINALRSD